MGSKNYNWYIKADTSKYAGQWIAIVDGKVASWGNDAQKVYEEAKKTHPDKKPSLAKVPKEEIFVL